MNTHLGKTAFLKRFFPYTRLVQWMQNRGLIFLFCAISGISTGCVTKSDGVHWEYRTMTVYRDNAEIDKELNRAAVDGWIVVGFSKNKDVGDNFVSTFLLKRNKGR